MCTQNYCTMKKMIGNNKNKKIRKKLTLQSKIFNNIAIYYENKLLHSELSHKTN